ncbi:UNVERIFIED_CONTAM: hypothetical protein Sradi_6440200 [Sesamum radiatum]|uniref:Uncharacterized protein n=1 Tax=Sesamum radiatum TaxID=300843 RepID=A0AAW2K424_SESRA
MIEESVLTVLAWEASTSKAKGKGDGCWMRKNDGVVSGATNTLSAPVASLG